MITTESLTAAQSQFASRFSYEDWSDLCRNEKFLDAINRLAFDEAEVVAWIKLNEEMNTSAAHTSARVAVERELKHSRICEFVRVWAAKTNRSGKQWKQSRQNHIRRLMSHGLGSAYFKKMAAEAGLV